MLGKIGSKLRTANDALAEAQKSWRDGDLTDREKRLGEREAALLQSEADLRQRLVTFRLVRAKAWLRRIVFGAFVIAVAIGAFFVGAITARDPRLPTVGPASAAAASAVQDVSNDGFQDSMSERSLPTSAANATSFRECVAKGDAYFKEIEAWPNLTSTGENAHSAAIERCGRTISAFDGG